MGEYPLTMTQDSDSDPNVGDDETNEDNDPNVRDEQHAIAEVVPERKPLP